MAKSAIIPIFSFFLLVLSLESCTERFVPDTETFEDLLVVEATITNELKKHQVKLTRTYTFEEYQPETAADASVMVSDNAGNQYAFQYSAEDSLYISVSEFQAVPGNEYTLIITTSNGETYVSTPEPLPPINQVSVDYEKKEVDGEYGVQISANSYDPTNSSHYYRYEYEETYKVVVPKWGPYQVKIIEAPPEISITGYFLLYELRDDPNTKICYDTKYSKEIKLTNTAEKSEDRVTDFPIRFITPDNYILNYKYSILVKQYVESYEAYTFYKTLEKVAGTDGTALSPNQPGFVKGNLSVVDNPDKKIIGYFEVASVSSERIFLDHASLFPDIVLPNYPNECSIEKLYTIPPGILKPDPSEQIRIMAYLNTGTRLLYKVVPDNRPGPYYYFWMVEPECTDCTSFASNEIPEFWE
ncbi:MAG TPA: DUF4249 domain-containing protein [Flavobacteriaceae bacterium]|nr:DUF4249 domain-containing protein [Flavobacteriaceae bacterium]